MVNLSSKPLILHVIDTLEIGGAEKLLVNTIETLPEYDHLVCYLNGTNMFDSIKNIKKTICLDHTSNFAFFKTVLKLRKIIDHYRPALVHSHLLKSTWVSRLAAYGKCSLIFTIHNKLSEDAFKVNKLSYYFEKLTYTANHAIVGVSKEVVKDYDQWIGIKGQSFIVYNLVEDKFFGKKLIDNNEKNKIRLVAIGNLRRQKNYFNLLKAFCYLRKYDIVLDIYGSGYQYEELNNFIQENKLPVRLMGKATNIDEVISNYNAFILPSIFEGYGIAVVEAMAVGLPVLLSDIDVFREVSNNEAKFFNPLDPKDIAKAIVYFYESPVEDRRKAGSKMRARAMQIASSEAFKGSLSKIYNNIILQS